MSEKQARNFQFERIQMRFQDGEKNRETFHSVLSKKQQQVKPLRKLKVSLFPSRLFFTMSEKPWRMKTFVIYTEEHFKGFLYSLASFVASD